MLASRLSRSCSCSGKAVARAAFSTSSPVSKSAAEQQAAAPLPPHLLTLADLSVPQIQNLITAAVGFKQTVKATNRPYHSSQLRDQTELGLDSLDKKTIALMFSKRSTRTRIASETATKLLGRVTGGHPMFLGSSDIQLGVNESLLDTTKVVSSMVDGIMARVGHHSEVETLAKHSAVPVINALSHLYHPTQILADLQALLEETAARSSNPFTTDLTALRGLTVAWVGDSNNILNEMLVTMPRLGINLQIATPKGYDLDPLVMDTTRAGLSSSSSSSTSSTTSQGRIEHTHDPLEAVHKADVVVTDTWISMGQEDESARRLKDFAGYQVTESMFAKAGANEGALFMHCLPRHEYEVDDEVFYGPRSIVFPEAENRKWTIMACFDAFFGQWKP